MALWDSFPRGFFSKPRKICHAKQGIFAYIYSLAAFLIIILKYQPDYGIYIIKTDRTPTQFGCKACGKERKTL